MMAKRLAQNLHREESTFATLVANYEGYKRVPSPTATLTLTQSGLLAALLEHQRYKAIELAWRRARREKMHAIFWRTLKWLLHPRRVPTPAHDSAEPLIGTTVRHT